MPNGAVCLTGDSGPDSRNGTGYCYNGRCFRVEASLYEQKLQSSEECEKAKTLDAFMWHF